MKIQADRKHLLDILGRAALVASKRTTKEILTRVLIAASNGQAAVYATDMEVSIALLLKCDVAMDGKSLLPMKVFSALRECTSDSVSIESNDNTLTVTCGTAELALQVENPDEFPKPVFKEPNGFTELPSESFSSAIDRTVYACDPTSSRFALGGVLLQNINDSLVAVGTDGRRLSKATIDGVSGSGLGEQCIVPERALKAISKLNTDGTIKVWCEASSFMLAGDGVKLSARLVEGRYPNWKQVVPDVSGYQKAEVASASLQRAIRQTSIVTTEETRGIDLSFSNGLVSMSAAAVDVGKSNVKLPVEYEGSDVSMKIDFKYALDFLDNADTMTTAYFKESASPMVLSSGSFINVIMPMSNV